MKIYIKNCIKLYIKPHMYNKSDYKKFTTQIMHNLR